MSKITQGKYLILSFENTMMWPMANSKNKHSKNILGAFYCTDPDDDGGEGCIACNVCYSGAPEFFAEDDSGNAYVKKQPVTPDEIALCVEQMDACPVNSIGKNG
jgi:ferredoxin